jgi:hypothetical protein
MRGFVNLLPDVAVRGPKIKFDFTFKVLAERHSFTHIKLWFCTFLMNWRTSNLLATANVVPSSLIIFAFIVKAIFSCETWVLTRATRHHISDDDILHSYSHKNLRSYKKDVLLRTDHFQLDASFVSHCTLFRKCPGKSFSTIPSCAT